jgi:hypothetical protein
MNGKISTMLILFLDRESAKELFADVAGELALWTGA